MVPDPFRRRKRKGSGTECSGDWRRARREDSGDEAPLSFVDSEATITPWTKTCPWGPRVGLCSLRCETNGGWWFPTLSAKGNGKDEARSVDLGDAPTASTRHLRLITDDSALVTFAFSLWLRRTGYDATAA